MPCAQMPEGAPSMVSHHGTSPYFGAVSAAVSRSSTAKSRTAPCYTLAYGSCQPLHHLRVKSPDSTATENSRIWSESLLSRLQKRFLHHHMTGGLVIKKFVIVLLRFYIIAIFAGASRGSCIFFNVMVGGLREIS